MELPNCGAVDDIGNPQRQRPEGVRFPDKRAGPQRLNLILERQERCHEYRNAACHEVKDDRADVATIEETGQRSRPSGLPSWPHPLHARQTWQ